jgi:hypothetical protein
VILPEGLDSPSRLLQVYIVVVLYLLDEFQVLNRDVIVVLPRMWEIFFDFLDFIVYVREFPQLLVRHLLLGKPALGLDIL